MSKKEKEEMYFYVMEFLEVIFIWYRVILFKRWEEEKSIK